MCILYSASTQFARRLHAEDYITINWIADLSSIIQQIGIPTNYCGDLFIASYNNKSIARLGGLEPTACGLEDRCSVQLSYRRSLYPRGVSKPQNLARDTTTLSTK